MFVLYYKDSGRVATEARYVYKKVALRAAEKMNAYYASVTIGWPMDKDSSNIGVMAADEYYATLGAQKRTVRNLMTGLDVEIDINTPRSCDPSSELYWSM